jgi:hypothetical protein
MSVCFFELGKAWLFHAERLGDFLLSARGVPSINAAKDR